MSKFFKELGNRVHFGEQLGISFKVTLKRFYNFQGKMETQNSLGGLNNVEILIFGRQHMYERCMYLGDF